jgi:hypothetical protein
MTAAQAGAAPLESQAAPGSLEDCRAGDPKWEDRYHRTALDHTPLGNVTTDQLQHYLACRRVLEEHLDEETVFEELCRLRLRADEETADWFDRLCNEDGADDRRARKLASDAVGTQSDGGGMAEPVLVEVARGMLQDGWDESQVRWAIDRLVPNGR